MSHLVAGRILENDPFAARLNLRQTSFRITTQPNQIGDFKMIQPTTQAPLPGVTAPPSTKPAPVKGVLSKIKDSGNGKDPSAAEKKQAAKKAAAKKVAAKAPEKKAAAKKPAAKAAKRTRAAADTKYTVAKNNAREGTSMHDFMAAAESLKKFTRDELVNAAKRKLGSEQRARAYFSWSLGHKLFKAA